MTIAAHLMRLRDGAGQPLSDARMHAEVSIMFIAGAPPVLHVLLVCVTVLGLHTFTRRQQQTQLQVFACRHGHQRSHNRQHPVSARPSRHSCTLHASAHMDPIFNHGNILGAIFCPRKVPDIRAPRGGGQGCCRAGCAGAPGNTTAPAASTAGVQRPVQAHLPHRCCQGAHLVPHCALQGQVLA